jgi:hypothetical protein
VRRRKGIEVTEEQQAGGQESQDGGTPDGEGAQPVTFEAVYKALPDTQRGAIDGHITGLKSALADERNGRKALEKQLRDLSRQAEDGSALKAQLDKLAEEQASTTAKATFFEAAHEAQVKNLRLAWLAATDYGLVDTKTGAADFAKLKAMAPELFTQKPQPQGNAGNGAKQTGVADGKSMNDFIRAASGRR